MSAHTPGPWSVELEEGLFPAVRLVPSNMLGELAYSDGSWSEAAAASVGRMTVSHGLDAADLARGIAANRLETCIANAHLIAAAPDLLAALKDCVAHMSGGEKSCGHQFECACVGRNAVAAIAKAEGRS